MSHKPKRYELFSTDHDMFEVIATFEADSLADAYKKGWGAVIDQLEEEDNLGIAPRVTLSVRTL